MSPDQLLNAREAIERGEKTQARLLLRSLLLQDVNNEQAWFMLAQVVEERHQTIDCLERVLRINPDNRSAQRALALLQGAGRLPGTNDARSRSINDAGATNSEKQAKTQYPQSLMGKSPESDLPPHQRRLAPNWSLISGGLIILGIILLAIFGSQLAPRDPLEITAVIKVADKYMMAPFPMLSPGYPLGSDSEGRDLLSRMLWAIRPTMILVFVVASVRLSLGTLIGLIAGWSTRWPGRVLDGAIAAAISIPVIIVALGGIAAVGVDLGIWAFIIALSLTGWVETARVVREQTQILRKQVYIEAARSLGGTNSQILRWHVVRQVLSLLWMLFAFEISSTLLLVAALGFLGYYIGGDIWISVSDATAAAISGMPELGQLLATTPVSITRPWPLMVIGAVVFVIVLGFNLLGEGLRRQASLHGVRRRSTLGEWFARGNVWADQNLWWPLSNLTRRRSVQLAGLGLVLLAVTGGLILWQTQGVLRGDDHQLSSAFAQEQLWVSARHDPYGTRWSQAVGPSDPQVSWTFQDESGFSGGPAVAGDGTVYIASNEGVLYALNPDGGILWQAQLPASTIGTPGISAAGNIILTDKKGGLSAVTPRGELEWHFQPNNEDPATTGPVIAQDGISFYVRGSKIQAVSASGTGLWQFQPGGDAAQTELLRFSPDGDFLFWGNTLLDVQDGSPATWENLPEADRYFSGADGLSYLVDGHEVRHWNTNTNGLPVDDRITWDFEKFSIARTSKDAGVTPDGIVWLFYTGFARGFGFGEDTRIVWLDQESNLRGNAFYETRNSQVIAVDQNAHLYTCGNLDLGYGLPECQAFSPGSEQPVWKLLLEDSTQVVGGALVPGRLYVASQEGFLYAIGIGAPPLPGEDIAGELQQENTPIGKEAILELAGEPLGPKTPLPSKLFTDKSGFNGGLVMAGEATFYIASNDGDLYAFNADGEIVWQVALPAGGVGDPAIGVQGQVYAADKDGGLSAFSEQGELIWYFETDSGLKGIAGPQVSRTGEIYYTVGTPGAGSIQAVSGEGEALWVIPVETDFFYRSPEVNSAGDLIFFRDEIYNANDGSLIDLELPFEVDEFFTGQDGKNYLLAEGTVAAWEYNDSRAIVSEDRALSPRSKPLYAGVTPEGVIWMLYSNESYWFTGDGQALGVSQTAGGWVDYVAGVDRDYTIYACGRDVPRFAEAHSTCFALSLNSNEPTWKSIFSDTLEDITGSILYPGRIFISTEEGNIYLIEESQ